MDSDQHLDQHLDQRGCHSPEQSRRVEYIPLYAFLFSSRCTFETIEKCYNCAKKEGCILQVVTPSMVGHIQPTSWQVLHQALSTSSTKTVVIQSRNLYGQHCDNACNWLNAWTTSTIVHMQHQTPVLCSVITFLHDQFGGYTGSDT